VHRQTALIVPVEEAAVADLGRRHDPAAALPIACRAREVLLIEEVEPGGRWSTRRRFPLHSGGRPYGVA